MQAVENRTKDLLMPIIKSSIVAGSKIISDNGNLIMTKTNLIISIKLLSTVKILWHQQQVLVPTELKECGTKQNLKTKSLEELIELGWIHISVNLCGKN